MSESKNSKLMQCPDCNKMISKRAVSCPGCGCPMLQVLDSAFDKISKPLSKTQKPINQTESPELLYDYDYLMKRYKELDTLCEHAKKDNELLKNEIKATMTSPETRIAGEERLKKVGEEYHKKWRILRDEYNQVKKRLSKAKTTEHKPQIICPHCHIQGKVFVETLSKSEAIEVTGSEKLLAAVATGGLAMLLGEVGPKGYKTQFFNIATCHNCETTWNLGEVVK